jgi:hypothetical protein
MAVHDAPSEEVKKNPVGRPTTYKPEYCEMLIDHMSSGLSFESFAGVVRSTKQTLYSWCHNFPEFLDAKSQATELCRLWWEQAGRNGMFMGGKDNPFQSAIWVYNMKCRFRDEWMETKEINLKAKVQEITKEEAQAELEALKQMIKEEA